MTHSPIVAYLVERGIGARSMTILSDSSVTRYLREAQFFPSKPHPADVQRNLDDSDRAVLAALENSPFASVRQLSRLTHPFDDRLSPSYPIIGICGASPSMGATCSVRCGQARESQYVPATIANARSSVRSSIAWHCHLRRVLV
jgi:hypothetical protein